MNHPQPHTFSATLFGETAPPVNDPLDFLVEIHDRIQEQLAILERQTRTLTEQGGGAAQQEIGKTLQRIETLGALHTEDEEQSLFPRLRSSSAADDFGLLELAQVLEMQHREKEAALAELAAHLETLPAAPAPTAQQLDRLQGLVARLIDLYHAHIMIENQRLVPGSKECLQASDLNAMQQEMRTRWGA
jgi:iron-sulfur cluster repair protein YtfE (RIC family)